MHYDTIKLELKNDIAVITLNRPHVMNALNTQMRAEITQAVTQSAKDARVVVLTGVGKAFCSCLLYTSPSPRDLSTSRMPSSA